MRIFVTGASGFVGGYVTRELLRRGHEVRALVRSGRLDIPGVTVVPGDIFRPDDWREALAGVEGIVHLVGIIREFPSRGITFRRHHVDATRIVAQEAKAAGVKRFLHMSANGAGDAGVSGYQTTKAEAEEIVKASGLDYTIFRPSVIFGDSHGKPEFCSQLADVIVKAPFMPVFGDGSYQLDPVGVEEVAESYANALEIDEAVGRTFHLGGGNPLPYRQILDIISVGLGRGGIVPMPVPFFAVAMGAFFLDRFAFFPVTRDQLRMLAKGNVCPELSYRDVLKTTPIPFTPDRLAYLRKRPV